MYDTISTFILFAYRLVDIVRHAQGYWHGCNEDIPLNAVPLHCRVNIDFSLSLNCNLVNQPMERKAPFAIAFLACGTLRVDFETIPFKKKESKSTLMVVIWYKVLLI